MSEHRPQPLSLAFLILAVAWASVGCSDDKPKSDGQTQSDAGFVDASGVDASGADASEIDGGDGTRDAGADDASPVASSCTLTTCAFTSADDVLADLTDRSSTDVVLLDADRDHDTDLLWVSQQGFASNEPPGGLDLSRNMGGGHLANSVVDATESWFYGVAADVDGDGASDVIVSRAATTARQIGLFMSQGDGTFQFEADAVPGLPACATSPCVADPSTDNGYIFGRVAAGDVDLDGDIDLLVPIAIDTNLLLQQETQGRPNALLINDGTGKFTRDDARLPTLTPEQDGTFCVALADFTGDHVVDIFAGSGLSRPRLLVNVESAGKYGQFVDQSEDDGTGVARIPDVTMRAFKCGVADFDGDEDLDVVVVSDVYSADGSFVTTPSYLFTNDGSGHFTSTALPSPQGGPYDNQDTAIGDLNNDGLVDIVISNNAETVTHNGHAIEILLQQSDGSFAQVENTVSIPDNVFGVELIDINLDGRLDIVAAVSKYEATGPGNLANHIFLQVP